MANEAGKEVTRGIVSYLFAAFLLLGAFVSMISGILTPSTGRVILAFVLLVAGLLLAQSGRGAFARASERTTDEEDDARSEPEGDAQDGRRDDPMDA